MQEIYHHIYNRGAHKASIFNDASDYWRMIILLYIANNIDPFEMSSIKNEDVFSIERRDTLVDIIAYCLMPNHIHIVIRYRDVLHPEKNLTRFMRKLCTGYSNYYNIKYDHSGTIWQGPYKKKDAYDKEYKETLINYVHLNPHGIKEPNLTKEAKIENLRKEAIAFSKDYEFSSYQDYLGISRQPSPIIAWGCVTSLKPYHQKSS